MPATNSWATRARGSSAASAVSTVASGPDTAVDGTAPADTVPTDERDPVGRAWPAPPEEQAPRASSRQPSTAIPRPGLRMVLLHGSDLLRPAGRGQSAGRRLSAGRGAGDGRAAPPPARSGCRPGPPPRP